MLTGESKPAKKEVNDKIIGGSGVLFLGLKEGKFRQHARERDTVNKIINLIHQHNPCKILTHATDDPHPDHRATCFLVKEAYDIAKLSCPLYTFDVWTPFSIHKRDAPKLIVDVSKTYKKKLRAIECFKSQLGFWGFLMNIYYVYAGTVWRNFFSGFFHGYRFAEVFYRLR